MNFERVRCPGCSRVVKAHVPRGDDGRGLRVMRHNTTAYVDGHPGRRCVVSERFIVLNHQGGWKVE